MSERRLLILCYFYPPLAGGGVHRVLGFTRHLPAHGWSCTVVCAGEEDYWVTDDTLAERIPSGTEVIRVRGGSALSTWLKWRGNRHGGRRSGASFSGLRRLSDWWLVPDSYAGWSRRAAAAAVRRARQGDVHAVLSTSPPDSVHLAARELERKLPLPWLADFRDPWVGLHFRTPPTDFHRRRQQALERSVVESANVVLAASRTHADALRTATRRAIEHLPNGFEPDLSATPTTTDPDHFTLVFTGTLSLMPDTETLLEALHDLLARRPEARRRLRARLVGPYDTGYHDRAVALGLAPGIVEFTGPLPHGQTRALQQAADLLLLWKPRGEGYRTMVPGKLYEYLDSGRPLLALIDEHEEAAELVRRAGGTLVPPARRQPLADAIERAYVGWRESGRVQGTRPDWLAGHTRAALAGRLAAILDRTVGAPK